MARITDFGPHGHPFEEEEAEVVKKQFEKTNMPKPHQRMRFIYEKPDLTLEQMYFHLVDALREDMGYADIKKITDVMSASEQSSIWQSSAQRLAAQQDKAAQYLQSIGALTKQLFQLVKEIRALSERLALYEQTMDPKTKKRMPNAKHSAEIALKGYWVDLVQGGVKNPASVIGMGRELGYVVLPDLFFGAPVMNKEDVDNYVNRLEFNRKIRELLARHLNNFYIWKEHTFEELLVRRRFTTRYLRQHYSTIKMYIAWIKPYLRNIKRLSMDTRRTETPDLLSSFEGAIIESELLAIKPANKEKGIYVCMSVHLLFRSRAVLESMPQSGYKQVPIYTGRADVTIRTYTWTKEEIDEFMKFKQKDDFDMIASVDESLQAALDALGKEFQHYLLSAEDKSSSSHIGDMEVKHFDDEHGHGAHDEHGGDDGSSHGDSHGGHDDSSAGASQGSSHDSHGDNHEKPTSMVDIATGPVRGMFELFFPTHKLKRELDDAHGEKHKPMSKQDKFELDNAKKDAKNKANSEYYAYVKLFKKKFSIPY